MPNSSCNTQVSEFRKLVDSKIGDKHEELMSRMGAIMAGGLLDAGQCHCWQFFVSAVLQSIKLLIQKGMHWLTSPVYPHDSGPALLMNIPGTLRATYVLLHVK